MTENMAARGEGLAGLVAKWRDNCGVSRDTFRTEHNTESYEYHRGAYEAFDRVLGTLEAAAPPSTAPASLIEASKNLLEACYQADALEELPQEIDGSLLDAVRDGLLAAAATQEPAGSGATLDRERREGLYLKFSYPLMEPHTPVVIERVNGDCTVSKFIIARDEAHELINQLCEFLRVGSPRKVGEDGATERLRCAICGHEIPDGPYHRKGDGTPLHDVCSYRETIENLMARIAELEQAAPCHVTIEYGAKALEAVGKPYSIRDAQTVARTLNALLARPSSVPVGEQKQEEGV